MYLLSAPSFLQRRTSTDYSEESLDANLSLVRRLTLGGSLRVLRLWEMRRDDGSRRMMVFSNGAVRPGIELPLSHQSPFLYMCRRLTSTKRISSLKSALSVNRDRGHTTLNLVTFLPFFSSLEISSSTYHQHSTPRVQGRHTPHKQLDSHRRRSHHKSIDWSYPQLSQSPILLPHPWS